MYCIKCGRELPDDAKFCLSCGTVQNDRTGPGARLIHLKCASCGAPMEVTEGSNVSVCGFCGSKDLIVESEAVVLARIKADEKKAERLQQEHERRLRAEREQVDNYKYGVFIILDIIFGVLSIAAAIMSFSGARILAGMIAVVQVALFGGAILIGTKSVWVSNHWLHYVLSIVGFVLVCLWMCTYNGRFALSVF